MASKHVVVNIGDLLTLEPLTKKKIPHAEEDKDLGRISGGWLAIKDGKIEDSGTGKPDNSFSSYTTIDAGGGLVIPGLVDSHTHPVFAGSRAKEFAMRINGASYQEIASAGGGITSTLTATRTASEEELLGLVAKRLQRSLSLGITTQEVKSGYGLSVEHERKSLEVLKRAKSKTPQHLSVTCLALHSIPPEHKSAKSYSDEITKELLPQVAEQKLAEWVDAFIEEGYFRVADVEPYALKAKELGLGIRIHADEFTDANAAEAAAEWGAKSADHLQFASDKGIKKMAKAGTIAMVLPGTSLYTGIPFTDARRFFDAGTVVGLATDFNPGSCVIDNLALIATVGALHSGFKPAEAIAGVTYVPAVSLGLEKQKGALANGFDADFLIYKGMTCVEEWLADFGRHAPDEVWINGELRHSQRTE